MSATLPQRLRLVRELAAGSEKRALLVEDTHRHEQVVASFTPLEEASTSELERLHAVASLQRDARAESIAPLLEVIEEPEGCWLLSEYFPQGDLASYLAKSRSPVLPLADALHVASRAARALAHVHRQGFVHGDVTPGNLLLDADGDAYLADFGFVQPQGAPAARARGTAAYMAPELQREGSASRHADLYSLGCLLYELLAGRPPFESSDPEEALRRHVLEAPEPVRRHRPEVPRVLEDLLEILLRKDPAERPSEASDLRISLDAIRALLPAPEGSRSATVARRIERERIAGAASDVAAGKSLCLRIRGAAGMGKSRLLDELRERAEGEGALTLMAATEEQGQPPYGVMAQWIRPMAAWLCELEEREAAMLRGMFFGAPGAAAPDHLGERDEVLRVFSRALRVWSKRRPLALLVDDLQWADADSATATRSLAEAIGRGAADLGSLLLAAAERSEAPLPDDELEALTELHLIEVGAFGESEIHELLAARGASRPTAQLIRLIADASDGSPLFADWLIEELHTNGLITSLDGGRSGVSGSLDDVGLPASLATAVSRALRGCDAETQRGLEIAACLGARFDAEMLSAIDGKASVHHERLDQALQAGLLQPDAGGPRFRHPLVWRAVYDGIDPGVRERIHQQIAAWAMEGGELAVSDHTFFVAHHLLRGGAQVSDDELSRWTRQAGDDAFERFAYREAADLYERALRTLSGRSDTDSRVLAELHARAGTSHYYSYDSKPAIGHLETAVEQLAEDGGVEYVKALNNLVRVRAQSGVVSFGDFGSLAPSLEAEMRRLGRSEPALRARGLMTLCEAHWTAGHAEETERFARRAAELGTESGEVRVAGEAYVLLGIASLQRCELSECIGRLRTAIAHARGQDDPYVLRFARGRMPLALLATGRIAEAQEVIRECIASDEIIVNAGDAAASRALLPTTLVVQGHFDEARRVAADVEDLIRRVDFPWPKLILSPALAYAHAMQRDFSRARARIRSYMEPGAVVEDPSFMEGSSRRLLALIDYYAGDPLPLAPNDLGEDLLPAEGDDTRLDLHDLVGIALHAELCDAAGIAPHPRTEPLLAKASERGARLTISWPLSLPRARGRVALAEQRIDDAVARFEEDLAFSEARGSAVEIASSRYELARALTAQGTRIALLRAREELDGALPVLKDAGPIPLAERCERLAAFASTRTR